MHLPLPISKGEKKKSVYLLDLSHVWMGTEIRWQQDDLKVSLPWQ